MSRIDRTRTTPTTMRRVGDDGLAIRWMDGVETILPLREIRLDCGCAVCRSENTGEQLLDPTSIPLDIRAKKISPVGRYALTFEWSDGHTTGIFPWEQLRDLANRVEDRAESRST